MTKITTLQEHEHTHIYKCPNCPFIGFEFYDYTNIEGLKKVIN